MKRNALITGSSRGMGKAEAIEFASRGYDIILNYAKSEKEAQNAANEIRDRFGVKVICVQADLSKEEVRKLASAAIAEFGKVDVLVNNAGISLYSDFEKKEISDFEKTMKINLYAPFLLTQILGQLMAENRYGKIINIGTIDVMTTYNP